MRIEDRAIVRIHACHAIGELMQVRLAYHDAPVPAQALDDRGIVCGRRPGQDDPARRRDGALDVDQVFDGDYGSVAGLVGDRNERVQLAVLLDASFGVFELHCAILAAERYSPGRCNSPLPAR